MLPFFSSVKALVPMEAKAPYAPPKRRRLRKGDLQGLTKPQLAFVAADILQRRATLDLLTIARLSKILGVSKTYIEAALRTSPRERGEIETGRRPLIPQRASRSLVAAWDRASPDQQRELVREREQQILDRV